jgi:hypothetical protein
VTGFLILLAFPATAGDTPKMDHQELPIGTLASGETVHKILGSTYTRRIVRLAREFVSREERPVTIGLENARVVDSMAGQVKGRCLIDRLLGKLYVRQAPSAEKTFDLSSPEYYPWF